MSADTLSDLLRAVRLRGAVFYYVDGVAPWVAEAPPARELIPAIMPAAEHLIEFHGVVRGSCWAALVNEAPIRLNEGDVVLFPQGDPHVMSSAPGMRAGRADPAPALPPGPVQLPFSLRMGGDGGTRPRPGGGGPGDTTVVCGFLGCDARPFNPLLASLPRVLPVRGAGVGPDSWVAQFLRSAAAESSQRRPGGEAVLERMSEMLFVEVLRRHVDGLAPEQTGWLAGLRDPATGRVLALLHGKPAEPWTLERLAAETAQSRSTLHERFVRFLGQPPMQYLTQWRMQVASRMLRETNAKVLHVALDVGYESEASFSRAFKRVCGTSPAAWRRAVSAAKPGGVPAAPNRRDTPQRKRRRRRTSGREVR